MKKFLLFLFVTAIFSVMHVYVTERTDFFRLREHGTWHVVFTERENGKVIMTWNPLPYPALYVVETFSETTEILHDTSPFHLLHKDIVSSASYELPASAIPTHYSITAYGLFGRLTLPVEPVRHPRYTTPAAPVAISHYTEESPASIMPYLVWHTVPKAVCYEVEILSAPPEYEGGTRLSEKSHLFSTMRIYTNGWQADLTKWKDEAQLWWRVRATDLKLQPIGEFSNAEPLVVDASLSVPDRPLLNRFDIMAHEQTILYPVYQWIPMHNQTRYEVELMEKPPAEENNTTPTSSRAWHKTVPNAFSCYDEYARPYAGDYYWRVRAVDEQGNTIGSYSDTAHFVVKKTPPRLYAAAFGDSITHGGGSLSYSPYNIEYDYTTYLDFEAMNLGRSGDTAHTTWERFDADVLPYRPLNLLILTGSNDLRSDISAAEVIKDLQRIRDKCEENDIRPIFLTLMPIHPKNIVQAFHTESDPGWLPKMREINRFIKMQTYYIDLEPYFFDETQSVLDPKFSIDGLHPDIYGKKLMAEIINEHRSLLRDAK